MLDTRVFKIHYESGNPEYGNRGSASQMTLKKGKGFTVKIEATNAEATEGWTDVTSEFVLYGPRA
jgi:hypothetical protein